MNYFFGNQRKQNSGRSKSCKFLSSKLELLPVEKLQKKISDYSKGGVKIE
jgi:hypothetical protein